MRLAKIADHVARKLDPLIHDHMRPCYIRDACDFATGQELSTSLLDKLCDMVERRLEKLEQLRNVALQPSWDVKHD